MATQTVTDVRIAFLNGISTELIQSNPTLLKGELMWESDTLRFKIGDGVTQYASLPYADKNIIKYADVVNNLTTEDGTTVPLSAAQGAALYTLIKAVQEGDVEVPVATTSNVGGIISGGDVTVADTGAVTVNNAAQAGKFSTARNITLTGDASGTVAFDGSQDVQITVEVADDSHNHVIDNVDGLQDALNAKAPLDSPALTGTPTAPTAAVDTNTTQIATTAYVIAQINKLLAASNAVQFKSTVTGDTAEPTDAKVGDLYVVSQAGTIWGFPCEPGDMIICTANEGEDPTWNVIQTNINGAVTGPSTSVNSNIAVFDGATGKIIKDGGVTIAQLKAVATTSTDGMMSAADKTKLDGIEEGAQVNVNADWNAVDGDAQILNKPEALKNPNAISVTVGTSPAVSYDGSTAQSITITPATVGAVAKVTGTSGNVVSFGADGAIADSGVVAANVLQSTDTLILQCSL